jgi:hypothetical protein
MSRTARLGAFAAVLAAVFAVAAAAGGALEPEVASEPAGPAAHGQGPAHGSAEPAHPVRGLAVAEAGLRIVVEDPELRRSRAERLVFRIVDADGATVRDFDVAHEKRMHLIVARRDLSGFQHLHPVQAADGGWSVRIRLDAPGSYRLLADFARDGEPATLATDLRVDGRADLKALPAPAPVAATATGYGVRLGGDRVAAGQEARLDFTITRDGETVRPEPYLGAGGHLVALREGDLAFLHVHPTEHDGAAFAATFPTEGRYRLFLQFKHEGRVHTAAFTREVLRP